MQHVINEELEAYAHANDEAARKRIEKEIWDVHGVEQATYIQDMSGSSRLTLRHGVVHYMSMVRRMQLAVQPIIEEHGGSVVKFEADNTFGRFPDVEPAIRAAIKVNRHFAEENRHWDEDHHIRVCIGIDFGRFLLLKKVDFYGSPVNLASKLGEDTADPGEVLVTDNAWKRLPDETDLTSGNLSITVSGVDISAHHVIY